MNRPYRLGKRSTTVEDTRARVVAAAYATLRDEGFHRASLDDIAQRAGVARATVYYQFGSKLGLLEAVIATLDAYDGPARRALAHENARIAAALYIRALCRAWDRESQLLRNAYGLAAVDPEAATIIDRFDNTRREMLTWLVKRLHDQGRMRDGVVQRRAVDTLWLLTSFRAFDHLNSRDGLPWKQCAAILTDMATAAIDGADQATG